MVNHEGGLFPLDGVEGGVVVLAFAAIFVASGVGLGGGGILVPVYILMLNFEPQRAIPLSNSTIFGASIVNVAVYLFKRHPIVNRPLIDWDLILVMEPVTILGALIGSFLNKLLPGWLTCIFLVIVLSYSAYRLIIKARKIYAAESENLAGKASNTKDKNDAIQVIDLEVPGNGNSLDKQVSGDGRMSSESGIGAVELADIKTIKTNATTHSGNKNENAEIGEIDHEDQPQKQKKNQNGSQPSADKLPDAFSVQGRAHGNFVRTDSMNTNKSSSESKALADIFNDEARLPPWKKVGFVGLIFLAVFILTVSRAFVECGSAAFWLITVANVPLVAIAMYFVRRYLLRKNEQKIKTGYKFAVGDVVWNERSTVMYPSICAAAGLFAGMFGIGGGLIKNPLMLEMNVLPDVAVATSSTMIFFTTGAATASYISFGLLPLDYGAFFFGVGFVATIGGVFGMRWLVNKLKRKSLLVFGVASVLIVSTVMMSIVAIEGAIAGQTDVSLC